MAFSINALCYKWRHFRAVHLNSIVYLSSLFYTFKTLTWAFYKLKMIYSRQKNTCTNLFCTSTAGPFEIRFRILFNLSAMHTIRFIKNIQTYIWLKKLGITGDESTSYLQHFFRTWVLSYYYSRYLHSFTGHNNTNSKMY